MNKEYKKEDVTILWQPDKCIHSAVCVKGLSKVFKPKESPWIQTENASKEEIANHIQACTLVALNIPNNSVLILTF
jgi:uncharacterized Fe-S cluster protein YjdI